MGKRVIAPATAVVEALDVLVLDFRILQHGLGYARLVLWRDLAVRRVRVPSKRGESGVP